MFVRFLPEVEIIIILKKYAVCALANDFPLYGANEATDLTMD